MSQQINLFNPVFLKQKKVFSAVTMLQGLGLIALGSVLFYFYAAYQVTALRGQEAESGKLLLAEQERLAKLSGQYGGLQKSRMLEDELRQMEARLQLRQEAVQALKSGAIGNTRGYAEYMRSFARQALDGMWLTGFDIVGDGSELSLQGRVLEAELVPAYLQRLKREPLLYGRQFSALHIQMAQASDKSVVPYLEFSLRSSGAAR